MFLYNLLFYFYFTVATNEAFLGILPLETNIFEYFLRLFFDVFTVTFVLTPLNAFLPTDVILSEFTTSVFRLAHPVNYPHLQKWGLLASTTTA